MTMCKHNTGVTCEVHDCETCGWSPAVAERRSAAIRTGVAVTSQEPVKQHHNARRVAKVNAQGRAVEVYSSIRMAAEENGISPTAVRNSCAGVATRFDVGGDTFRYID